MDWRVTKVNGVSGYSCMHGVFHPDRKGILLASEFDQSRCEDKLKHICDGCCQREDFPGFLNLQNFKQEIISDEE